MQCTIVYTILLINFSIDDSLTRKDEFTRDTFPPCNDVTECQESLKLFDCKMPTINKYRTIDGTCNNLKNPLLGASDTPFRRVLDATYKDDVSQATGIAQDLKGQYFDHGWPSARYLVEKIVTSDEENSKTLTHMHMQWGQFLDHDIDLLGKFDVNCTELNNDNQYCMPIRVAQDDQVFGNSTVNKARHLPFTRSLPVCQPKQESVRHRRHCHREHINRISHFVDASMIYGSNKETQRTLRSFSGGLLKITGTGKGDLPFSTKKDARGDPLFMTGDERVNEHTGLVVIHALFHREHNRIAKELSKLNPCWGDEGLYQEARKIMGAMIQIITYNEYLPAMYGEKWFDFYIGKFKKYSKKISPTVSNVFATAPFRFGHSQIRNKFSRLCKSYRPKDIGPLKLADGFFNPGEYYRSGYTDPILRGLVTDEAGEVDEFLSDGVASLLITSPTSVAATDLAALNIQRGRDHALPPYRRWERHCIKHFGIETSFERPSTTAQLIELYGYYEFRYRMDLWFAGLAEKHLNGSSIGPTFACLMAETFKAIRDGDRFWWENPGVFTLSQRKALSKVTLSKVICESSDEIESVQPNAFKLSQSRVSCSLLPELDLSQWKDQDC